MSMDKRIRTIRAGKSRSNPDILRKGYQRQTEKDPRGVYPLSKAFRAGS